MVRYEIVDKDKVTVHWNKLTVRDMEDIVKRVENILEVMERNNMGVLGYAKLLAKIEKDPKSANFSEDLQKHYISRSRARNHLKMYTQEKGQ